MNQIQNIVLHCGYNCMATCYNICFLDNYWLFYYSVSSTFLAVTLHLWARLIFSYSIPVNYLKHCRRLLFSYYLTTCNMWSKHLVTLGTSTAKVDDCKHFPLKPETAGYKGTCSRQLSPAEYIYVASPWWHWRCK